MVRDGIILLIQECNNAKLIVKKMMMALINGMRREYHLTGYTQDVNAVEIDWDGSNYILTLNGKTKSGTCTM